MNELSPKPRKATEVGCGGMRPTLHGTLEPGRKASIPD
jgi:hypothetical protein